MTQQKTTVATEDLGAALTYLEGLVHLIRRLEGAQGIGRTFATDLAQSLQDMDTEDSYYFAPLRYETAVPGMGWDAVATQIADVRHRLVEAYGNDVL
ncbi:MAG TPA: hypothetical protein VF557_16440 [Jatrophihabitans sp.]|jgi:hypothetical protein|uniref:hypothetical protein n=1 Tax=Jatrophihabitans sp. TaxID=1932789 RepID=UPI002F04AB17